MFLRRGLGQFPQHPGDLAFSGSPSDAFARDALIVDQSSFLRCNRVFDLGFFQCLFRVCVVLIEFAFEDLPVTRVFPD